LVISKVKPWKSSAYCSRKVSQPPSMRTLPLESISSSRTSNSGQSRPATSGVSVPLSRAVNKAFSSEKPRLFSLTLAMPGFFSSTSPSGLDSSTVKLPLRLTAISTGTGPSKNGSVMVPLIEEAVSAFCTNAIETCSIVNAKPNSEADLAGCHSVAMVPVKPPLPI
jgi:hypothetical protein